MLAMMQAMPMAATPTPMAARAAMSIVALCASANRVEPITTVASMIGSVRRGP